MNQSELSKLSAILCPSNQRIVIVGIGSELHGDDAIGIITASRLAKEITSPNVRVILGGTAPENTSAEIRAFKPDLVVFIDALKGSAKEPGVISLYEPDQIEGLSFSTHTLPLSVFISYLSHDIPCKFLVVSISARDLSFGGKFNKEVARAADEITSAFIYSLD